MESFQKIDDKGKYQGLLDKVLFKTFFHNLEWEEFLEKEFKWLKFEHYLYKEEVLVSFARYKILGKEKLISHPFCEYGGPLPLKEGIEGRDFRRVFFLTFKDFFKVSFHPKIPRYFKSLGLKEPDSSRDTYFIENIHQKKEEDLWPSFRKTLRHSIRKSQQHNLEIKKCQKEDELRFFYTLYLKNVKKHRTIPYPFSFFKYFLYSKDSEIILAKKKDKIIAGSVFLFYDEFIHYFLNASDQRYKKLGANYIILWNQIKNYLGKNYQTFDLGGTRRASSLEIFKRGWGGKRYPIFEMKNFTIEKLKSSNLRNVLGLFPVSLLEKMSPSLLKYKL